MIDFDLKMKLKTKRRSVARKHGGLRAWWLQPSATVLVLALSSSMLGLTPYDLLRLLT